ncbi:MAG: hypothetical protein GY832_11110 [Chloroflexi bacterium]|nr:hypothetical protein [Chloroflexota bacterium]
MPRNVSCAKGRRDAPIHVTESAGGGDFSRRAKQGQQFASDGLPRRMCQGDGYARLLARFQSAGAKL